MSGDITIPVPPVTAKQRLQQILMEHVPDRFKTSKPKEKVVNEEASEKPATEDANVDKEKSSTGDKDETPMDTSEKPEEPQPSTSKSQDVAVPSTSKAVETEPAKEKVTVSTNATKEPEVVQSSSVSKINTIEILGQKVEVVTIEPESPGEKNQAAAAKNQEEAEEPEVEIKEEYREKFLTESYCRKVTRVILDVENVPRTKDVRNTAKKLAQRAKDFEEYEKKEREKIESGGRPMNRQKKYRHNPFMRKRRSRGRIFKTDGPRKRIKREAAALSSPEILQVKVKGKRGKKNTLTAKTTKSSGGKRIPTTSTITSPTRAVASTSYEGIPVSAHKTVGSAKRKSQKKPAAASAISEVESAVASITDPSDSKTFQQTMQQPVVYQTTSSTGQPQIIYQTTSAPSTSQMVPTTFTETATVDANEISYQDFEPHYYGSQYVIYKK